ncbi:hypothetical protein LSH36_820g00067 [Paralvinella palmiformis]|uniref:Centromere protein S n=1 Tax=Paralvinella palmiformis TaxID=53620 RepID=A0AAD9J0C0_9ANNE|nr:hypothetical protein LSH36_820g00067 [Paralvinella palmiformis]
MSTITREIIYIVRHRKICVTEKMENPEKENYEKLAYVQRLKAAVHYTVAEICEERGKECDVTFAKQVISALSEATFRYSQMMSRDLELFAKHAKRSTINTEDVKLLVRKSPQMLMHIQDLCDRREAASSSKKQRKKKTSRKDPQEDEDDK